MEKTNKITVIIPTYKAENHISALLEKLENQTLKPARIVLVNSGSADELIDIAEKYKCKVISINPSEFDHGSTRNAGVWQSDSEFFILLTQDVLPTDNNLVAELIRPLQENPSIAVSFARQIPRSDADPIEKFVREFNYPPASILKTKNDIRRLGIKTFFCSNSCAAYRRDIFDKLGGFENGIGTNEDMLFAAKAIMAGYGVFYCAQAKVYHSHNYTLLSLWRRYFKIGKFFARYKWLCEQADLNGEGRQMMRKGLSHFWRNKQIITLSKFILQMLIKAAGYECGRICGKTSFNVEKNCFKGNELTEIKSE